MRNARFLVPVLMLCSMAVPAFAAIPTELSDLQADLVTDAGTIVGYAIALVAATAGVFYLISLFKKAISKGK